MKISRVGFALCIDIPELRNVFFYAGMFINQWESAFWKKKLFYPKNPSLELYYASIDIIFCVLNHKNEHIERCIRVAGNYTCFHLPWHKNFRVELHPDEYEFYLKNNNSTYYFKQKIYCQKDQLMNFHINSDKDKFMLIDFFV